MAIISAIPNKLVPDKCRVEHKDTKCSNGTREGHKGKLFTWQVNGSIQY